MAINLDYNNSEPRCHTQFVFLGLLEFYDIPELATVCAIVELTIVTLDPNLSVLLIRI